MPHTPSLSDYQSLASTMEAELDTLALRLRSSAAHLHVVRAVGMIHAAVRELGAAVMHEQLSAARAPSNDAPLTVEVISLGADRADELVRTLPADVVSMSTRTAALRLGAPYDAGGARVVGEVLRRNGWRQSGFDNGRWFRIADLPVVRDAQDEAR